MLRLSANSSISISPSTNLLRYRGTGCNYIIIGQPYAHIIIRFVRIQLEGDEVMYGRGLRFYPYRGKSLSGNVSPIEEYFPYDRIYITYVSRSGSSHRDMELLVSQYEPPVMSKYLCS